MVWQAQCNESQKMCLGIPGKVLGTFDANGLRMGKVQFGGAVREACLAYVPEANVGDYVVVHVGFAISQVDEGEALRTYKLLEEMGQLSELELQPVPERPEEDP